MALQVWLPLNNRLRNTGLSNVSVTTCGTTSYVDGRRTKALSANGSSCWDIRPITLGAKASMSVWVKTTDTNAMFWVLGAAAYGNLNFWRANSKYYLNKGDSYNNPFQNNGSDVAWHSDGKWHHYVTTFDGTTCLLYVDGNYYAKAKTYISPAATDSFIRVGGGFNNTHSYDTQGTIEDFRVYDNCLTPEDVKQLYQDKVYHFSPYWKHNENVEFGDAIHIGRSINQTAHNLTQSGSSWYFNGSSSYVEFDGLNMSGGSVSAWVNIAAKPTAQRFIYYDPVSKMVLGFLSNGNFLTAANGTAKATYQSTGMTWGQWNHIVATWDAARQPTGMWVNGVAPATASTNNWTTGGTVATIGRRIGAGTADYLQGYVNSIRVYSKQLTQAEAKQLYNKGIEEEDESIFRYMSYSGYTWLKVLHHNSPATNLFTSANGKRNDDSNLYSRLGLFDNNTNFRMPNNRYQFMVREKLESTSVENQGIWTQTTNPTASTAAGFQLVSSNVTLPRSFALTHQDSRAVFDDSGSTTWWCSCACNTAYNGGIPGFYGIVKTGYVDLYVRVDDTKYLGIADVPSDYTILSYIEATGTQWINTDLDGFDADDWEIFCEWKLNAAPTANYGYVFGVYEAEANNAYRVITNQKSTTNYLVNPCSKAGGGSVSVNSLSSASTHTALVRGNGTFMVDGSSYSSGTFGTALPSANKMGLFKSPTGSSYFKGRIYAFWAKKGGSYRANMVPAKRNSDNVVGMYDTVRRAFFTNSGTGSFTAGSVVTI